MEVNYEIPNCPSGKPRHRVRGIGIPRRYRPVLDGQLNTDRADGIASARDGSREGRTVAATSGGTKHHLAKYSWECQMLFAPLANVPLVD